MARLNTVNPETASGKAKELLGAVKSKLGLVPNMTKVMANAPSVLEGYLGLSGALGHGVLPAKLREQLAIVTAQSTSCTYCLSAHSAIGKMVGLTPEQITASRTARSSEAKTAAALQFARALVTSHGSVGAADVEAVRSAGWNDAEIAEIIAHTALNLFTNIFNKAAGVDVDFPVVDPAAGL